MNGEEFIDRVIKDDPQEVEKEAKRTAERDVCHKMCAPQYLRRHKLKVHGPHQPKHPFRCPGC